MEGEVTIGSIIGEKLGQGCQQINYTLKSVPNV